MAHDDLFVVMCKVIAYLYDCMKNDREPDVRMLAHDGDMLRIRRGYVESVQLHYQSDRHCSKTLWLKLAYLEQSS